MFQHHPAAAGEDISTNASFILFLDELVFPG